MKKRRQTSEELEEEYGASIWEEATVKAPPSAPPPPKKMKEEPTKKRKRPIRTVGGMEDGEFGDLSLDTKCNPYTTEIPLGPPGTQRRKLDFEDASHTYWLQDERGEYSSSLVLSGSKVVDYMKAFADCDGNLEKAMHEIVSKGFHAGGGSGAVETSLPAFIRSAQAYFLDLFTHEPLRSGALPFAERAKRMKNAYFIPSDVCERVEIWVLDSRRTGLPLETPFYLDDEDDLRAYRELLAQLEPCPNLRAHPLFRGLFPVRNPETAVELGKGFLKDKFSMPSVQGTALHVHLEHRLLGKLSRSECVRLFPVPEREDLENIDILLQTYPPGYFAHLEMRVGSFVHKICGSIDAVHVDAETNELTLYDWKRANSVFDPTKVIPFARSGKSGAYTTAREDPTLNRYFIEGDDGIIRPVYSNLTKSNCVYRYAVNMATYRKLCMLNGHKVNNKIYLVILLPQYRGFRKLEINLARECKGDAISPIRLVNWIFAQRREHLRQHFKI